MIWRFSRMTSKMRPKSYTLAESFQIRQIIMVLKLLKPLALVFFISALATGALLSFLIVVLSNGYNEHSSLYKAAANVRNLN